MRTVLVVVAKSFRIVFSSSILKNLPEGSTSSQKIPKGSLSSQKVLKANRRSRIHKLSMYMTSFT
jgi:hypothetical protein